MAIGFTKGAAEVYTALPREVVDRYRAAVLAIEADPYGQGRPLTVTDPYDRVMDLGHGWIRYSVRPLVDPEVLITDLDYYSTPG
ncbi:hypothetical protein AB0B12_37860 [Streptomyces sp. NPDC044780]|uniref:hypothetical protein n=1 Tax=unclassified Streptomyces TaxID=2593676 RepID=UPI00340007CC